MVKSVAQVEHARALIFGILTDYSSYPSWVPGCESCIVQSSAGTISTIEITLNSMKKITLGLRFDAAPDQLLKFEMVSGTDVKSYTGSYKLMNATDGSGTVVVTELELDAGPMAPKFIVDRMIKKTLEQTGEALGKYAKTVAAKQPPVEASGATASPAKPAVVKKKFRKSKCLLRVYKTDAGEQIWYSGQVFKVK
jgi:ribosome-associated toxin RatA of RatAB toxin-antitoxin module